MENKNQKTMSLATKMGISLVCGLVAGFICMFLKIGRASCRERV